MNDRVSGSRIARLGRLAWMSRKTVPLALARLRGRDAAAADPEAELDETHRRTAEELLGTLGELKGLAMKVGQMLSYMEGALPADVEPGFRRVLTRLQAAGPALEWDAVEAVLAEELGTYTDHFAEIEREPFAAASIGQVHRARLHDETAVAVKIQYPGVAKAVAADLDNLDMFKALARPMLGALGAGQNVEFAGNVLDEIRARMLEELDYVREAEMQQRFKELLRNLDDIYVPRVFAEHSTRRVLTTELVSGLTLDEAAAIPDQDRRDRYGLALTRMVQDGIYEHRLFNADPHPGNYLFREDGTVVLLDFGCVKELPAAMVRDIQRYHGAAIRATRTGDPADWRAFDDAITEALRFDPGQPEVFAFYREFLLYIMRPILKDEPFAFTPEYTSGANDLMVEGKKKLVFGGRRIPKVPKLPPLPGDYTFLNRLQWGFFSVLTKLRARVNWHRLLPADVRG